MNANFSPPSIPSSLKLLLLITLLCSLFSSLLSPYLVLSWEGVRHLFLWQFLTYPFVHPFPSALFTLLFNLFLIWSFGASLIERIRPILFFTLYFGATLSAGLCAFLMMSFVSFPSPLSGSTSAVYALLTAWILLNPESHLLLFFTFPCKARTVLLVLIGINLAMDLSQAAWVPLFADCGGILFSYLFTVISCRARSRIAFLTPFELFLHRTLEKVEHFGKKTYFHSKIYDIKSGDPILSDEQFMDAMLARISLYGENSLTADEKQRMQQISSKKASKKKQ